MKNLINNYKEERTSDNLEAILDQDNEMADFIEDGADLDARVVALDVIEGALKEVLNLEHASVFSQQEMNEYIKDSLDYEISRIKAA